MATRTAPSVRPAAHPDRLTQPMRHLAAPLVGTGVLMATYLLLRPYGDHAGGATAEAAQAFASTRWVVAHLCGALALASFARLALRLDDLGSTLLSRAARWTGLAGAVLVLPYYGAETFGLHALGRAALAGDQGVLPLVDDIRDQPVALTMFGLGLILLAVCGLLVVLAWHRRTGSLAARSAHGPPPAAVLPPADRPDGLRRPVCRRCPPPAPRLPLTPAPGRHRVMLVCSPGDGIRDIAAALDGPGETR